MSQPWVRPGSWYACLLSSASIPSHGLAGSLLARAWAGGCSCPRDPTASSCCPTQAPYRPCPASTPASAGWMCAPAGTLPEAAQLCPGWEGNALRAGPHLHGPPCSPGPRKSSASSGSQLALMKDGAWHASGWPWWQGRAGVGSKGTGSRILSLSVCQLPVPIGVPLTQRAREPQTRTCPSSPSRPHSPPGPHVPWQLAGVLCSHYQEQVGGRE